MLLGTPMRFEENGQIFQLPGREMHKRNVS